MEFRESSWTKSVAISCLLPITGGEYKSKDWESRNSNVKIKNEKILRACFKVYNDIHLCVVFSIKEEKRWIHGKKIRFSPRIMRAACGIHCGDLAATLESLLVASSMTDPLMQPHPEGPGTQPSIPGDLGAEVMIWCHGNFSHTPHLPYSMLVHQNRRCLPASFWRWRTTWDDMGMFLEEVIDMF